MVIHKSGSMQDAQGGAIDGTLVPTGDHAVRTDQWDRQAIEALPSGAPSDPLGIGTWPFPTKNMARAGGSKEPALSPSKGGAAHFV